jgi:hydroxymethylpyrimidine/phosphomethylpyrimidine kinase
LAATAAADPEAATLHKNNIKPISGSVPVVLTIAGSDSGGGAGIQADLKTFMAMGCHGVSAIAALTAQNTQGVRAIHHPPVAFLRAQIDAIFDDFPVAAVKIGMLGSPAVVETVASALRDYNATNIVLDPVLVATTGARLSDGDALVAMNRLLMPMADVLTPNIPEAEALLGRGIDDRASALAAAADLLERVRGGVLLKGGHLPGDALTDLYVERDVEPRRWHHARRSIEGHGTGCTLASAIASGLALGLDRAGAVDRAIAFLQKALAAAYRPGRGGLYVPDVAAAM